MLILLNGQINHKISYKFNLQKGFTLSEVLLCLAIIGVIAALTIPSLIQNTKNEQIVTSVKKATSMVSQAYNSFIADGIDMDTVFGVDNVTALNQFCTKFNCVQNCGTGIGCFPDVTYPFLDGVTAWGNLNQDSATAKAILADGSSVFIKTYTAGCNNNKTNPSTPLSPVYNTCGLISFDINGFKGPNVYSRDVFQFWITRTGIIPCGSNSDGRACVTGGTGNNSNGCTAKVLTDGAINY